MRERPKILLVEDNQALGARIYEQLARIGTTAWMMTESDFRLHWSFIEAEPPDVIVIDIMLAWAQPRSGDSTEAQPHETKDLYTAGVRCAEMLAANAKTRNVPIIFYTVVPQSDVAPRVAAIEGARYVPKTEEIAPIVSDVLRLRSATTRASS